MNYVDSPAKRLGEHIASLEGRISALERRVSALETGMPSEAHRLVLHGPDFYVCACDQEFHAGDHRERSLRYAKHYAEATR